MKKTIRFFTVMLLTLAAQAFFTSCNGDVGSDSGATHYTVTFYKNYEVRILQVFRFTAKKENFQRFPRN